MPSSAMPHQPKLGETTSPTSRLPIRHIPIFLVVLILLGGFFLRTTDIGAAPLQGDETWLSFLAFDAGHNGRVAELGVNSSAGINQPPFFHHVFAIPYSLSPDPRIARLFMSLLQLIGMAVLYSIVRRYWFERTALVALAIYAVIPTAVWAGRYMWNPYLGIPFIIGYIATGFLAAEGKRWARWLHLPLIACAIGAHPILAVTGVLSIGFIGRDWFQNQMHRKLITDYIVGILLAILVLAPWGIGVIRQSQPSEYQPRIRTAAEQILEFTAATQTWLGIGSFSIHKVDYIPPDEPLATVYRSIGWLTLAGSVYIILGAILRRRDHFPDLMIGLSYLAPPLILLFSPTRTYEQYLIGLIPVAAVIQAIILTGRNRLPLPSFPRVASPNVTRIVSTLFIGGILAANLAYTINALIQVHNFQHIDRGNQPSLQDMIMLRNSAVRPGIETIYLVDSQPVSNYFEQDLTWLTLAWKGDSRVLWGDNFALPVPDNGATYVGYADAELIPELYANPAARITFRNTYRVVDLPPHSQFIPSCLPEGATQLSNNAKILGYYLPGPSKPEIGHQWTIYVLWQASPVADQKSYQLFNHLVDEAGTKYAQNDISTLATNQWREDDQYVSKVTLTPNENLPFNQPLFLRVGMYSLPTLSDPNPATISAVGNDGNLVGGWITIPICG